MGSLSCRRVGIVFALSLSAACARKASPGRLDASTEDGPLVSIAPDAAVTTTVSARDAGFERASVAPVEARRTRSTNLTEDSALFGAAGVMLEKHFGSARGSFDVQSADLTARGRRVVLVSESGKPTNDARPIALVLDDTGALVWSTSRPVAGIMSPVGPIAVAPAPLGRVALAACDPPTSIVALRLWDDDGSPFADFQALTAVESCDSLSLLYWPRHGWIVVAVRPGVTRARLISESGAPAWGDGLDLGVRSKPGAVSVANLAGDTDDTFVLVQLVQPSAEEGSPFHALAFRYDTRGGPIWKAAVDLGALARPPAPGERVKIVPMNPGVRVTLPSGREVDVRPSGDVVARGQAPR